MAASQLVYRAAGSPSYPGDTPGSCRLCGETSIGAAWDAWVKDTFTDHDKVWPGAIVCRACLFCADDHNLALQTITGRDKPQRMRNYSHIVTRSGRWLPQMKNQKREIATALLDTVDPPRVTVISLAGQKHLIMRARVGWWHIEESVMAPDPDRLRRLLVDTTALYAAGATKSMIESGDYGQGFLRQVDLAWWAAREDALRPHRGSLVFALAVWLAQKPENENDGNARSRDSATDPNLGRDPSRLQEQVQILDLESVREPGPQRRIHDDVEPVSQPDLFAAQRDTP